MTRLRIILLLVPVLLLEPVRSFEIATRRSLSLPARSHSCYSYSTVLLRAAPEKYDKNEDDPTTVSNAEAMVQMELEEMMRQQDSQKGLQPAFLGKVGNDPEEDNDGYNAIPMFTGVIVLLFSLFFTFYGFYVFFSDNDPIFLNVRPTEPPPDSWYPGP